MLYTHDDCSFEITEFPPGSPGWGPTAEGKRKQRLFWIAEMIKGLAFWRNHPNYSDASYQIEFQTKVISRHFDWLAADAAWAA